MNIQNKFGNGIKRIRYDKGYTQQQFAAYAHIDRSFYASIESGNRNVTINSIFKIAYGFHMSISQLFEEINRSSFSLIYKQRHKVNKMYATWEMPANASKTADFPINTDAVVNAMQYVNRVLASLPPIVYTSVDFKAKSGMISALFCLGLEKSSNGKAKVNPVEKGHPDVVKTSAFNDYKLYKTPKSEQILMHYPKGIEVKCTAGNLPSHHILPVGTTRINDLKGITWQAHHRTNKSIMAIIWDFYNYKENNIKECFPIVTGAFFSNKLEQDDWGKISGTTGHNTKVTGMKKSARQKMWEGRIAILNDKRYLTKYKKILG